MRGANIGMTAIYLSGRFPGATVYCIEPATENIQLLKMNVEHGIDAGELHIIQAALYTHDGEINISNDKWAYNIAIDSAGNKTVPAIRMDSFLRKTDWKKSIY
jgi:FkbM family methyltransferase